LKSPNIFALKRDKYIRTLIERKKTKMLNATQTDLLMCAKYETIVNFMKISAILFKL